MRYRSRGQARTAARQPHPHPRLGRSRSVRAAGVSRADIPGAGGAPALRAVRRYGSGPGGRAATAPPCYGDRFTVVKERKTPLETGTFRGMCRQLGSGPSDLQGARIVTTRYSYPIDLHEEPEGGFSVTFFPTLTRRSRTMTASPRLSRKPPTVWKRLSPVESCGVTTFRNPARSRNAQPPFPARSWPPRRLSTMFYARKGCPTVLSPFP